MLVHCPAYYSVSAPKAELLNKIKDMPEEVNEEEEQVDVNEKKVKKELGAVFCSPQQEGKGPVRHHPHPNHHWTLDLHGTLSNFLIALLSFSFLQMTVV